MPYLAFNLNDGNEFIFDLLEDRLSLGRNPRNEIVIDNNQISSFHAEFARQPNGVYVLTDLKSSNGTHVNGKRIESAELKPGDKVRFGQLEATFREMELPGQVREKRSPAPDTGEKRRVGVPPGGPGSQPDFVLLETAPPVAVSAIPKPAPPPLQIVARAPLPAPPATPQPSRTPVATPDDSATAT